MLRITIIALSLALCATACSKGERLTTAQRQKIDELVSKRAPTPQHALDIKFGDAITLIGYDLSAPTLEAGRGVDVTWYYRVDKAPGEGWKLFTHLADAKDVSRVNYDKNGTLRQIFQPGSWEAGTYVTDPQTILLPADWDSPKMVVYLGFWKGSDRLKVTGPSDSSNRARVLELTTHTPAPDLPQLTAVRASSAIKPDGKLDEETWKKAQTSLAFVNTMTGEAAEPKVTVKTAWDEQNLYVAFDVADDYLKSSFENNDDHLWEQDCVEIMVDPDGDGKNYFEMQVSPRNKSFDTRYDSRRNPQPFGHVDWNAGIVSGVEVRGKVDDDKPDQGYTAELAIPWTAFAAGEPKHEPPLPGDDWRINFYLMDAREKGIRAVGWSPPRVGDFHMPKRFGKLSFAAPGATVAATQGADAAAEAKPTEAQPAAAPAATTEAAGTKGTEASKAQDATKKDGAKPAKAAKSKPADEQAAAK